MDETDNDEFHGFYDWPSMENGTCYYCPSSSPHSDANNKQANCLLSREWSLYPPNDDDLKVDPDNLVEFLTPRHDPRRQLNPKFETSDAILDRGTYFREIREIFVKFVNFS